MLKMKYIHSSIKGQTFVLNLKLFRMVWSPGDALLLQEDLERILSWSSLWKLSLNSSKCKVLTLTLKKQPISHNYKLAQSQLERVANHKDLSIFIHSKLTSLLAKANCTLGIFCRHCRNLDPKTKQILFYSLVTPGLEFASVCFNSLTVTHKTHIERIQNNFIPFLGNNIVGSEVIPLVSLLFKCVNSKFTCNLCSLFPIKVPRPNLRNPGLFIVSNNRVNAIYQKRFHTPPDFAAIPSPKPTLVSTFFTNPSLLSN